jgi:hypothetical protein
MPTQTQTLNKFIATSINSIIEPLIDNIDNDIDFIQSTINSGNTIIADIATKLTEHASYTATLITTALVNTNIVELNTDSSGENIRFKVYYQLFYKGTSQSDPSVPLGQDQYFGILRTINFAGFFNVTPGTPGTIVTHTFTSSDNALTVLNTLTRIRNDLAVLSTLISSYA